MIKKRKKRKKKRKSQKNKPWIGFVGSISRDARPCVSTKLKFIWSRYLEFYWNDLQTRPFVKGQSFFECIPLGFTRVIRFVSNAHFNAKCGHKNKNEKWEKSSRRLFHKVSIKYVLGDPISVVSSVLALFSAVTPANVTAKWRRTLLL